MIAVLYTYTPQITVTDKAGNVAAPVAGTPFTVDTVVSPTAAGALKADAVNDTGSSASDGLTKNPAPVLTGTAEAGATVSVAVGGLTATGTVDATGHWSVTVPGNLTDGGYTPQITVTDAAGNVAAPVAGAPFTVDTVVSPVATGALQADAVNDTGTSASDGLTRNTTPTLTGAAEAGSAVSVVVAGQTLTATADAMGHWSVAVPTALADNTYTPQISVTDKAGNTATAVAGTPFTVDTMVSPVATGALKADAINDTGTSSSDSITKNTTPTLTGTAEAGATLSVVVGGQTVTGTVDATGHWSLAVPTTLTDNTYTPQITVTDKAGNVAAPVAGTLFTVDTVISPTATGGLAADVVNDTGISASDHITNNTLPTLAGLAESGSAVSVVVGGQTLTSTADMTGHWSVAVAAALSGGNYTPGITVTDKAGNTSTVAGTGFMVDTQAPNPPISLSVLDNVVPHNDPLMIDGTRTDDPTPTIGGQPGSIEGSTVVSVYDNGALLGTAMSAADGTWSYTPGAALMAGTHSITVTATDAAGNEGGSSDPFTLIEDFTSIVGGNLADTVLGTAGNDTIYGQGGNDSITAGNGSDLIFESGLSGSGADTIDLGAGNDTIAAGDEAIVANDVYIGGAGVDQLRYNNGGQPVTLQVTANDALGGVDGTATGTGVGTDAFTSFEDLRGGSGADAITVDAVVTNGVLMYGYGGNDTILGGSGADTVMESGTAGSGADSVDLGAGNDILNAGDEGVVGNDTYLGGVGIDQISYNGGLLAVNIALTVNNASGGAGGTATGTGIGTDTLSGFESVYAGYGTDTLTTSASVTNNLTLAGMMGNDTVQAGSGNDQINEYSIYGSGTDSIDLGAGNDTLFAGAETVVGNDIYSGGTGTDVLNYASAVQAVVISATADNAAGGVNGTTAGTDVGNDTFTSFEDLEGGAGADTISVNAAVLHGLTLVGHAGNDTITGGSGDDLAYENVGAGSGVDVVDLGTGNDIVWAGDESVVGNDTYIGGTGSDTLNYAGGLQAVSIHATADNAGGGADGTATGTGIGIDTFTGFETLEGGGGADTILVDAAVTSGLTLVGNDGNDTITAGSGSDILWGGVGNDSLLAGNGDDLAYENANTGSGVDTLDLGAGNDTIWAGDEGVIGNDTYIGGAGSDVLNYAGGVQAVSIHVTADNAGGGGDGTAIGLGISTDTFTGFEMLEGGGGADTLTIDAALTQGLTLVGNDGNDTLTGGGGNDTLWGGADNDSVLGGNGDDLVYENVGAGSGADLVDLGAGNDTIWAGDEAVVGSDTYIGGSGTDVLSYQGAVQAVSISILSDNAGGGVDGTATGAGIGTDSFTGFELFYTATAGANSIVASAGVMHGLWISGQGGSDTLTGGSGNDTLIGAAGNDVLTGGAGADTFSFTALNSTAGDGGLGIDSLLDFSGATDTLDLASMALAAVNAGNLSQFVQMSGNQLQVDRDGSGTGQAWTTVVTFDGTSTVPTDANLVTMYGNGHLVI